MPRNPYLGYTYLGTALVIGFLGLIFVVLKLEATFQANPEMATLEGREVVMYSRDQLNAKNREPMGVIEIMVDPKLPPSGTSRISGPAQGKEEEP